VIEETTQGLGRHRGRGAALPAETEVGTCKAAEEEAAETRKTGGQVT
jgi:hypothetical protein